MAESIMQGAYRPPKLNISPQFLPCHLKPIQARRVMERNQYALYFTKKRLHLLVLEIVKASHNRPPSLGLSYKIGAPPVKFLERLDGMKEVDLKRKQALLSLCQIPKKSLHPIG
ncbi:hypothetical protein [Gorillibacterium sp. CAU 1737]|uniref:hypothetical protein n=1 Tax=Gorillibacterium sp. CAU 1737 TaxID=3140362 RepID=UPI0032611071